MDSLKSLPLFVALVLIGTACWLLAAGLQIPYGQAIIRLDGGFARTGVAAAGTVLIALGIYLDFLTRRDGRKPEKAENKASGAAESSEIQKAHNELPHPDWADALLIAETVLAKIEASGWRPDLVLGLGRSGAIWGGWLAGNLGSLPIAAIDIHYHEAQSGRIVTFPAGVQVLAALREFYGNTLKVLAVEGATSTGQSILEFITQFKQNLIGWEIRFAVLYKNRTVATRIDFAGEHLEPWPKNLPWHLRTVYRPYMSGTSDV
ncbi:MAG TPA: hypothetical protein VLK88_17160 [Gemmatimonadales bacterium]|nr:hypothetical protein [Gemmatimonadales bacterium]